MREELEKCFRTIEVLSCRIKQLEKANGDGSANTIAINDDENVPRSSGVFNYNVENYDSLVVEGSDANMYDFAYVRNPQGTKWLPASYGGTYYPKGVYMYDGVEWISQNDKIVEALSELTSYKEVNSDYTATNQDAFINVVDTSIITLPDANRFPLKQITIKNDHFGTTTITGFNGQLIDEGIIALLSTKYEAIRLQSTGSEWKIY